MSTWFAEFVARESFNTRVENWNEKNSQVDVTLEVDTSDVEDIVQHIIHDRPDYPLTSLMCLKATNVRVLPEPVCYTTDGNQEITIPSISKIVVTYSQDLREECYICDTPVLIMKTLEPSVEFITLDYKLFEWESGKPLTSQDAAPGKRIEIIKVRWTIDRIYNFVGSGQCTPAGILKGLNGRINENAFTPHPLLGSFPAQTVKAQLDYLNPSSCVREGGTGLDIIWYSAGITFECHTETNATWNKWYRIKRAMTDDDSGWYTIYLKKEAALTGIAPFTPYEITDYFSNLEC